MNKLRVVVVGVGHLGRFHAQKIAQIDEAQLTAVVDSDVERRQIVGAELGVPAFASMKEALTQLLDERQKFLFLASKNPFC